jgi:hypothetical protein
MSELGFIVLRHANSEQTGRYWSNCYDCIRRYYPENEILVIDDNSNYEYIEARQLYKTTCVQSEYHGRGELLPYYYYYRIKPFERAVIIHDSVFVNAPIDFHVDEYKMLWDFCHFCDDIGDETRLLSAFNDQGLLEFYQSKHLWRGCFGGMTVISHDFLSRVYQKYDLSVLLDLVLTKHNRCSFERVIACLLQKELVTPSLLGDIHAYCPWGVTFDQIGKFTYLPLIKVWTGR